jgi:hypothetical protein
MDAKDRIRNKLLELGIESIHSFRKAKLAHMRTGDESTHNEMINAAILYNGICQMAEFTGICSYSAFESQIQQLSQKTALQYGPDQDKLLQVPLPFDLLTKTCE